MARPPDLPKLQWDTTKLGKITSTGPKFLTMKRTNNQNTLLLVSPFLIQKAVDGTCGEVSECKKTRNGQVIIKTKNHQQANKLMTLTGLTDTITVEITENKYLNQSRGVIYCNDLRGIEEAEILEELKKQNVSEVKKIMKKTNNELTETGLIILTFDALELPTKVNIGYESTNIRPYIPPPTLCRNCFNYGHPAKYCKLPRTCPNCSALHHTDELSGEVCNLQKTCHNCSKSNQPDNHAPTDRKCPIFIKETELQSIKTIYKVDNKTARTIYEEKHQHQVTPYATVLKTQTPIKPKEQKPAQALTTLPKRPITNYSDLSETDQESATSNPPQITKKQPTIFPRNTPKRMMTELKKAARKNISTTKNLRKVNTTENMDTN